MQGFNLRFLALTLGLSLSAMAGLCVGRFGFVQEANAQGGAGLPASPAAQEGIIPDFFAEGNAQLLEGEIIPAPLSDEEMRRQVQDDVRKEAFDAAVEGLLPLRPEEIRTLLEKFDQTQESVEVPIYPGPRPEVTVETIPLDPGTRPAIVKVAHGHVTTINILDVSGAPWPIEDISWAGNFEVIQSSTGNGTHILRITPQSEFAQGNMSIRLLTLKTPVILTLQTSRDIVHYRFDAIIPDYGPLAEAPLITSGINIQAGNPMIASVLQGIAPSGSKKLSITGADSRTSAYMSGSRTYVRTPLTLLSPSWNNSVTSADGMRVYEIQNAPVLLLSDGGKMIRALLSEREDIFDDE